MRAPDGSAGGARQTTLKATRAIDGPDDAREDRQHAVAGLLHDPPLILLDQGRHDLSHVRAVTLMRTNLVGTHEPAVAHDVRHKDGSESAFLSPNRQAQPLQEPELFLKTIMDERRIATRVGLRREMGAAPAGALHGVMDWR